MAIVYKCKACGANLDVTADTRIAKCQYCGTSQAVPTADNDKKVNLFNRANKLRMSNDFDKAAGVYENIAAEFPEEAEAYWGLCLCKYGIEYVDDPASGRKIPTCHRTSRESIFDDENFDLTLENSDQSMVSFYRSEAKEIDRLQQAILEIASKEAPFDIFICYKETDENGQRTADSVIAQDMYDALTKRGWKVFFSRITLEDKLGKEYEPYIFSALSTAKVMLAVGTSYEYFNAVWVKNEWTRFLDLMKSDKSKTLIPCYRDIDAYDLPSEFKNLQGQDMSKLGFMQDLIRGIDKLISPSESAAVTLKGGATVESLALRAEDFLAERNWKLASEYSEKVLDIDPRYARAYLLRLMACFYISSLKNIDKCTADLRSTVDYRRLMDYADDHLKEELYPHFENAEISRKKYVYDQSKSYAASDDPDTIAKAINGFASISGWDDADRQCIKCKKKLAKLKIARLGTELKAVKRRLLKEKSRIFASVINVLLIAPFWLTYIMDEKTKQFIMNNVGVCLVIIFGYIICSVISTARLTGWGVIGTAAISFFTAGLFGAVCSVIILIKDIIIQRRAVKELNKDIDEIKNHIGLLDQELTQYK